MGSAAKETKEPQVNSFKLTAAVKLQNAMNCKVHPEWASQGFSWGRAIMVEGVEALEHYGWKWWKKQEPDMPQVRMELVDIWHFILSYYIERHGERAVSMLQQDMDYKSTYWAERPIRLNFDKLISEAGMGGVHLPAFMGLMHQCSLSWDELHRQYIGKNVLNMFRQDNGYKTGSYIKDWNGREDNAVLVELMGLSPSASPEALMGMLSVAYNKLAKVPEAA
jgi:dimeric dUTPase (all-alpha-NTP-PPase superfamily)